MIKSPRVPLDLLAARQMQRHPAHEAGVPIYLPAFAPVLLGDPARADDFTAEADFGAEAGGLTIGCDEDDDFY